MVAVVRADVIIILTLAALGYLKFMMDVYHGSFFISLPVLIASISVGVWLGGLIADKTGANR